jgi:hypothetical protein
LQAAEAGDRWAGALQVEVSTGGDDLWNDEIQYSKSNLGEGLTPSIGLMYRPMENSAFELQGFLGYKLMTYPVYVGPEVSTERTVLQLLANYPFHSQWYVGGGLVLHSGAEFEVVEPGGDHVEFDDAVGFMVQGGWNWVGLQCTWMDYKSETFGTFDASHCGVRFTWHFPQWRRHPLK